MSTRVSNLKSQEEQQSLLSDFGPDFYTTALKEQFVGIVPGNTCKTSQEQCQKLPEKQKSLIWSQAAEKKGSREIPGNRIFVSGLK